ncbi:hypothetical protein LUZ60_012799 [Juncus effusus]|nr:hypothetical protein LUZ60_012799 [Juncus effusus]
MLTTHTVSRVSSSPCLTDTCQEFNIRGNALEMSSSAASTSYNMSSQHQHGFRCNQSKVNNHHSSSPDQSESASCPSDSNLKLNRKQKLLLLCNHALTCNEEPCTMKCCSEAKKRLKHVLRCSGLNCKENCVSTRNLITHFNACVDVKCDICGPVREGLRHISRKHPRFNGEMGLKRILSHQNNLMHCNYSSDGWRRDSDAKESRVVSVKSREQKDEFAKSRDLSVNNSVEVINVESLKDSVNRTGKVLRNEYGEKMEIFVNEPAGRSKDCSVNKVEETRDESVENMDLDLKEHKESVEKRDLTVNVSVKESAKQNARGASLLDSFTPEEIKIHLTSLIQSDTKVISKKAVKEESEPDQNTCSLCKTGELLFAPPPRYCIKCSVQIASHGVYYSTDHSCTGTKTGTEAGTEVGTVPVSLCSRCYNTSGECVKLKVKDMLKSGFKKQMNYAETDADSEWWVQCSKCDAWQHQVCALFNGRRKEANAEYTCANCFLKEVENRESETLTLDPVRVLGAQDLPKTELSDHVEKWLLDRLETEREERASNLMKEVQEVPGVEGLCVRVVSCVDRVVNVQPYFLDFMKEENYPSKFPYKSKAILLFQKIEGVDVCLFAMYVQEYGSKCDLPNQRHVYISYIDSVKYFQPEIRSASGEALRTFVYHQLLIGYLDYCKKKGFTSCSIWACPPTKHDDYILYCHPTTQKMPKAEKLRSWYQMMINRAVKENVVIEKTNLYDYYLIPTNDSRINISAAHLPYCDNDFWPGEAERILSDKSQALKKEAEPKGRAVRAAKRGLMDGKPDDILLLYKLGERMRSLKEDFMMIFLQPTCKHCRRAVVSATKWVCNCCKNFLLCDQCYTEEEELPEREKHPACSKHKHTFHKVTGPSIPPTADPDPLIHCSFLDSRIDLLRLCQTRSYQFDSLRRAKHSTMMILHGLHTPACAGCHAESDEDMWRCVVCRGFWVCEGCFGRGAGAGVGHRHELVRGQDVGILKKEYFFPKELMEALVHASECMQPQCLREMCLKLKLLFRHGVRCEKRREACIKCRRMWQMMVHHSRICNNSVDCRVPRCRDIKDHERRQQEIRSQMNR